MGKLQDKVALIIGHTSLLTRAIATLFIEEGAYVFIAAPEREHIDSAMKLVGRNTISIQADPLNPTDLDRLLMKIDDTSGGIDIVFANLTPANDLPRGALAEEDLDANIKALFFAVKRALLFMRDGSSIIVDTSVTVMKDTVRSLTRTLSKDLNDRHIRVNAVNIGLVGTSQDPNYPEASADQMAEAVAFLASDDSKHISGKELFVGDDSTAGHIPIGRTGTPDQIAKAIVFLASDDSRHITGTELFVGAGFTQL